MQHYKINILYLFNKNYIVGPCARRPGNTTFVFILLNINSAGRLCHKAMVWVWRPCGLVKASGPDPCGDSPTSPRPSLAAVRICYKLLECHAGCERSNIKNHYKRNLTLGPIAGHSENALTLKYCTISYSLGARPVSPMKRIQNIH